MPPKPTQIWDLVSCPETGAPLAKETEWMVGSQPDGLTYPVICGTPVLQPFCETYLDDQQVLIQRAMARFGEDADVRDWFQDNFGRLDPAEPLALDTEVEGEGYEGVWEALPKPSFLEGFAEESTDELILELFESRHHQLALDLACGQGAMLQRMARSCEQVIGVEHNFYLAALANRLLRSDEIETRVFDPQEGWTHLVIAKEAVRNAHVICGNVSALPFHEPLFDWVHCGHVLDLVDDPEDVIRGVLPILKPGGRLSIATPWDVEGEGHFDGLLELLEDNFTKLLKRDGVPWIRWNHKRRFVLHEDWVWVGKFD